ncbi:MAG: hypothetical protein ACI8RZ_006762 [Myxococcota bacterium]|jgi:hypothetical protein
MLEDASEPLSLPRHIGPILAVVSVVVFMIAPMVFIKHMADNPVNGVDGTSAIGATVALGALFRAGGRTMLRSTVMSAARTMARALTRRIVRSFLPMALRLFLPSFRSSTLDTLQGKGEQSFWVALALGVSTLGLSFYGVVTLSESHHATEMLGGLSLLSMSALACLPLLIHYLMFYLIGRLLGVGVALRTDIDGILLQAYFTGAMSYLPLASDVELDGSQRDKAICASSVLCGFVVLYAILSLAGEWLGNPWMSGLSSQLLLYAFVLSFPLPPLDGSDVWAHSRWAWLALFLAILMTFLGRMPESFYEIL